MSNITNAKREDCPTIETPRLFLRDFTMDDFDDAHEYAIDEEVVRFMEWGPNSEDDTKEYITRSIEFQHERPRRVYELAVTLRDTHKMIGGCGVRVLPHDPEQADIGYCYNSKYWRKGFAKEACLAVIDFGFTELNLHRIYATCDAENIGSASVLGGSGMRQEAHFLQDKRIKGKWRDTLLFAILRSEWEAKR